MSKYLADITLSLPRGKSLDDWELLTHLLVDIDDKDIAKGLEEISEQIKNTIKTHKENWV